MLCWGLNQNGALGNGTTEKSTVPVAVNADHDWASITAGFYFTCASKFDGSVWCWGEGYSGIGTGTFEKSLVPSLVGQGPDLLGRCGI
jgi:hypothetical protein